MKDAAAFDVEGLVKGYLRGTAWHCTFYTPAGRQRRKLGSKNKRQAERRAREIAEFIQREDWEALSKLDWKPKPHAGTFSIFVRVEFLPKYCTWSERTRRERPLASGSCVSSSERCPCPRSPPQPSRPGCRNETPKA